MRFTRQLLAGFFMLLLIPFWMVALVWILFTFISKFANEVQRLANTYLERKEFKLLNAIEFTDEDGVVFPQGFPRAILLVVVCWVAFIIFVFATIILKDLL